MAFEHDAHFAPEEQLIRLELALAEHARRMRVQREQETAAAQEAAARRESA
ncbi:hypothetical protein [[Actinomadura] parvosata]|uniref:hypothetical protein n=1 Tax=[Actinomadura] parvosata TaxID=1955412 RepID=UPI0012BCCD12|nr:hypothetical protein [Nonomuraea sp. ATCC 55076]